MDKQLKETIKIRTTNGYITISVKNLYNQIGKHLEKTRMMFCFLANGDFISRYDCEDHGYVFKDGIY